MNSSDHLDRTPVAGMDLWQATSKDQWSMPTPLGEWLIRYNVVENQANLDYHPKDRAQPVGELGHFRGVNEARMVAEIWEAVAAAERDGHGPLVDEVATQCEAAGFQHFLPGIEQMDVEGWQLRLITLETATILQEGPDHDDQRVGLIWNKGPRPLHGTAVHSHEIDVAALLEVLSLLRTRPALQMFDRISDAEMATWRATRFPAPLPVPHF